MQITDEMVEAAWRTCSGALSPREMRVALEAALGAQRQGAIPDVVTNLHEAAALCRIHKNHQTASVIHQAAACIEDLAGALRNIAAYDDRPASEHLEKTGSWGQFDEPGGAQIARATLERWGLK